MRVSELVEALLKCPAGDKVCLEFCNSGAAEVNSINTLTAGIVNLRSHRGEAGTKQCSGTH